MKKYNGIPYVSSLIKVPFVGICEKLISEVDIYLTEENLGYDKSLRLYGLLANIEKPLTEGKYKWSK